MIILYIYLVSAKNIIGEYFTSMRYFLKYNI